MHWIMKRNHSKCKSFIFFNWNVSNILKIVICYKFDLRCTDNTEFHRAKTIQFGVASQIMKYMYIPWKQLTWIFFFGQVVSNVETNGFLPPRYVVHTSLYSLSNHKVNRKEIVKIIKNDWQDFFILVVLKQVDNEDLHYLA